jgi:hypothetical protein
MIHLQRVALAILVTATAACTAADSLGEVELPLSASTPDGTVYRLRDGAFQITDGGGLGLGLSTEEDPDALTLHADLDAGSYTVELLGGWRFEHSVAGAPFEPVAATLVSASFQSFEIVDGGTAEIVYVFRVAGIGDVELGGGVDIGIDVYTPCDPVAQTGCLAGERCTRVVLPDYTPITSCVPAGTVPAGGACASPELGADDCVAGTICAGGVCAAICELGSSSCNCLGAAFSDVPGAGVCVPTCDPLAQDCPEPAAACYPTGSSATCAPVHSPGTQGEPCTFLNDCAEGSVCAGGELGCAFMCSLTGVGPTCADGPGAGFGCLGMDNPGYPDLGFCIDCAVYPTYCSP